MRMYSVCEVIRLLGLSESSVRRLIKAGTLKTTRIGPAKRRLTVSEGDLAAYLSGSQGPR